MMRQSTLYFLVCLHHLASSTSIIDPLMLEDSDSKIITFIAKNLNSELTSQIGTYFSSISAHSSQESREKIQLIGMADKAAIPKVENLAKSSGLAIKLTFAPLEPLEEKIKKWSSEMIKLFGSAEGGYTVEDEEYIVSKINF